MGMGTPVLRWPRTGGYGVLEHVWTSRMLGNEVPGSCKVAGAMWVSVGPPRGHFTIQQILVPILKFRN